jgi:AcrR family transcriptional regulator
MEAAATKPRRRRRSPEIAEREILDAAQAFLRERPFRELTVDEVMRRTDLSRPSFYVYFRDRHHLMLRVVEDIGAELHAMSDRWFKGHGDPVEDARAALAGVTTVFVEHGPALRALADAATDDPEVEAVYGALRQSFIDATAEHIDEQLASGDIAPLNAYETARALILLNEAYLLEMLGPRESQADPELVHQTLLVIWLRTLYGVSA